MAGRRLLAVVSLIATLFVAGVDSRQGQAPDQTPIFQSDVDLIAVDVAVIDGGGRPIEGLTAGDFSVSVDGRERAVTTVEFIGRASRDIPPAGGSSTAPATAAALPAPPANLLLLVDAGGMSSSVRDDVLRATDALLDALETGDRVALSTLPNRLGSMEFTTHHALVRERIRGLGGWSAAPLLGQPFTVEEALSCDRPGEECAAAMRACAEVRDDVTRLACISETESEARALISEMRARAAASFDQIVALLGTLDATEGPKTLVWLTEELLPSGGNAEFERIAELAARSRTRIYVLRPSRLAGDASQARIRPSTRANQQLLLEPLERITGLTGGTVLSISPGPVAAVTRLLNEVTSYYLLGVEGQPGDRDGRPHRLQVQVRRPGVSIRARREFVALPRPTLTRAPAPPPAAPPPAPAAAARAAAAMAQPVWVAVDPLHPAPKATETQEALLALRQALERDGFRLAASSRDAGLHVHLSGQRLVGAGRGALPSRLVRGGGGERVLIRATVSNGDEVAEVRGRAADGIQPWRVAAEEAARSIDTWLAQPGQPADRSLVAAPAAATRTTAEVAPQLLDRIRAYAGGYQESFAAVVAEEHYRQEYWHRRFPFPAPMYVTRRALTSEMGFSFFPGAGMWFGFRDVREVDGAPVKADGPDVRRLFLDRQLPSSEQFRQIAAASAHYNLGPTQRNFNVPTVTLLFASPENRGRCRFELLRVERIDGVELAVVAFTETARPTLITRNGNDRPSRGLLWVEPDSGRIHRTDLSVAEDDLDVRLTTWYSHDARTGMMVPTSMREVFDYPDRLDEYVETEATYTNFRRFETSTQIAP